MTDFGLLRVERHDLGPRLHVAGRRVHECHAGLVLAALAVPLALAGASLPAATLGAVALWLVAKDWRDLHPATRDTAAWSLGLHRRPDAPPAPPVRDRVPLLAGLATAVIGAINVASAMTPELPARVRDLLAIAPAAELHLAHALALPAGLALTAAAWPLARRRRKALHVAVVLLGALGVLNLLKGLDVEETLLSWTLAFVLWRSRAAFWVLQWRSGLRGALRLSNVAARLERGRAAALVRLHGSDSLSAFKLRGDLQRRYSADGEAVAAYRVEAGTLLLAGDPVGPDACMPAFLDELRAFARRHGLALGAVGASERFASAARAAGLRRLYLGDEALLDGGPLDLSGRPNKNLRNAVRRVERAGFVASAHSAGSLDAETLEGMDAVSASWRAGAAERGFSMAHDALVDDLLPDAVVVLARDEGGAVRGFLHFVPVYGRRAMSLAFMRRDRDTPNGLTEFLVIEAARLLGERGIDELSLNFVTFGRWLREPANRVERVLARGLHVADRWFQIERLLRFNAKFSPHWQPRYLLFERPAALPRVALAALWAEGQLPRPPRLAPPQRTPAHPRPAAA
jgi:lysyl-tRNA synthetase class 2